MIKGIIFDFNRTIYDPDSERLTDGAIKLLDQLAVNDYKLCLLSKKTKEDRRELISSLRIEKYFIDIQVIDGSKSESNFQRCIDKMALDPKEILVVGDRARSEIYLGNKMGMTTIWYMSGKFATEFPENKMQEPTYIIKNLEGILDYLN